MKDTAIGGTFGGVLGILILCYFCECVRSSMEKKAARDVSKARERRERSAIEFERARVKGEQRRTKQERGVEDAVVKRIHKSKAGSQQPEDFIAQWERMRAARAGVDAATQAQQAGGSGARRD